MLGNGCGPTMGRMMVLSQMWWFQSISGLKKHRNSTHIRFSYFSAKIPMPGNGRAWPQMGHMIVLSQNWWFQSIPGLKIHRNRAPTCHNSIHIGFLYFPAKIPTLENGRGPEMSHMMVLSQNWWSESIPGLKKHRNRAPTCRSSLSLRFSMFAVKIPTLEKGRGQKRAVPKET